MLRLHGSYQLDQLSNREVCMKIMKVLLHEHNEFTQYVSDDVVIISNLHCCCSCCGCYYIYLYFSLISISVLFRWFSQKMDQWRQLLFLFPKCLDYVLNLLLEIWENALNPSLTLSKYIQIPQYFKMHQQYICFSAHLLHSYKMLCILFYRPGKNGGHKLLNWTAVHFGFSVIINKLVRA